MAKTNLGKVSLTPRGAYDATAAYKRLDVIRHGGSSYLALRDFTGVEPDGDNVNTMLLAARGDDGRVTRESVEAALTGDVNTHTHPGYCTPSYVDGLVGDINSILDVINGEAV